MARMHFADYDQPTTICGAQITPQGWQKSFRKRKLNSISLTRNKEEFLKSPTLNTCVKCRQILTRRPNGN